MKKTTFLKKVKKLGLTVDEPTNGRRCYIHHNGQVGSWFWQENWQTGELEGTNWHIKREGEKSCSYTDYFPGYFTDNASQMLNRLVPPGSKYKVGSLVKCKDNKRSTRYNRVGRMGIMIDAGDKQAQIQWITPTASEIRLQERYPATYARNGVGCFVEWVQDNDLDVVSAA